MSNKFVNRRMAYIFVKKTEEAASVRNREYFSYTLLKKR